MLPDDPSSGSASCRSELLSSSSFVRVVLRSFIPLLLVKPLRGLGPVEWDLEPSIDPDVNLRKIGLVIGRQAF
jgi:hypothetical protein